MFQMVHSRWDIKHQEEVAKEPSVVVCSLLFNWRKQKMSVDVLQLKIHSVNKSFT